MNFYVKQQSFFWRKILIFALVLATALIFLNLFSRQVRNSFFTVLAPVSGTLLQAGRTGTEFFSGIFAFTSLYAENTHLKQENQHLLASLSSLQEVLRAGQDLGVARQNTQADAFALAPAGVIGLDTQADTMLIGKGSADGIALQMPVISKEKVLFGKVIKVYPGFSQVMLISHKQSALAVKVQSADAAKPPVYAAIKGSGSLSVYMDLINADSGIAAGDVLVTSAQEGIFPKDLLVGKITSINTTDTRAFQTAQVAAMFNPKNTDTVFVITNYLKK